LGTPLHPARPTRGNRLGQNRPPTNQGTGKPSKPVFPSLQRPIGFISWVKSALLCPVFFFFFPGGGLTLHWARPLGPFPLALFQFFFHMRAISSCCRPGTGELDAARGLFSLFPRYFPDGQALCSVFSCPYTIGRCWPLFGVPSKFPSNPSNFPFLFRPSNTSPSRPTCFPLDILPRPTAWPQGRLFRSRAFFP